jgi:hypothetical protein
LDSHAGIAAGVEALARATAASRIATAEAAEFAALFNAAGRICRAGGDDDGEAEYVLNVSMAGAEIAASAWGTRSGGTRLDPQAIRRVGGGPDRTGRRRTACASTASAAGRAITSVLLSGCTERLAGPRCCRNAISRIKICSV